MNKINMSDFLQTKKIKFVDGEVEVIKPQINGEISINEFNEQIVKTIQKEILDKLTQEELTDDTYFTYKVFPYIANINMNITFEEFNNLMTNPKRPFSLLLEMVMNEINEMFETAKDLIRINEKAEQFKENNKEVFESGDILKQQEELLLKELQENFSDKEKRDEILDRLNELRKGK